MPLSADRTREILAEKLDQRPVMLKAAGQKSGTPCYRHRWIIELNG